MKNDAWAAKKSKDYDNKEKERLRGQAKRDKKKAEKVVAAAALLQLNAPLPQAGLQLPLIPLAAPHLIPPPSLAPTSSRATRLPRIAAASSAAEPPPSKKQKTSSNPPLLLAPQPPAQPLQALPLVPFKRRRQDESVKPMSERGHGERIKVLEAACGGPSGFEATLAREFVKHPSKLIRILSDETLLDKLTPVLNLEAKRLLCRAAGVPCTVINAIALFISCNLSHLSYITMARRFYLPSLPTILSRMAAIAGPIIPIYARGQCGC